MTPSEPRIFISYSATESALAQAICAFLETNGLSCWIAPRDMEVGNPFSQTIIEKIESSYALVLILSRTSNESDYVFSEIANAFQRKIPVLEFRIHPVALHKRLELYLRMQHYLDATTGRPEDQFPTLYNHCAAKQAGPAPQQLHMTVTEPRQPDGFKPPHPLGENAPPTRTEPAPRPAALRIVLFVAAGLVLAILLYLAIRKSDDAKDVPADHHDTSQNKTDSQRTDSITDPHHRTYSTTHLHPSVIPHTIASPVTPVSKTMLALEGATFIDGPSPELAKSDDKISFFGLQGNSIQFNLHVGIYAISGKMKINGNHLEIIQAEPSCTGGMSVVNDGTKLTGSFQVASSDSPTPVGLSRQ